MKCCKYCEAPTELECTKCAVPLCNARTGNTSHLVLHLVRTRHVTLSFGERPLACARCGESNVFRLSAPGTANTQNDTGSVDCAAKSDTAPLSKPCSQPDSKSSDVSCHGKASKAEKADLQARKASGAELQSESSTQDETRSQAKSTGSVSLLSTPIFCKECRPGQPLIDKRALSLLPSPVSQVSLQDIEKQEGTQLPRIKLRTDARTYVETLTALVGAEREREKAIRESMRQENVVLRFEGPHCYFYFSSPASGFRLNIGDEVRFTHRTGLSFTGTVCEDQFTEELKVQVGEGEYPRSGYVVEYIWNDVCYRRMCWALQRLYRTRKRSTVFPYVLTGHPGRREPAPPQVAMVLEPPGLPALNEPQRTAVRAALTRTLTLVQGPPGTGKTVVSAIIVYNLVRQFRRKVLVVAPSNTAVDQLAIQINNTGLKVLRVVSRRRESRSNEADFLCLHTLLREFEEPEAAKHALLSSADVVCCTCITAGQQLFNEYSFPFVLIDEAVQATEPLSLVACAYGAAKLIMVGDHRQLGPTTLSEQAARCGLRRSLFERLIQTGVEPYLLTLQYRMHPELCRFPSEYFYGGQLQSGAELTKRLDFPNNFFYACHGREEISQSGTSFFNRAEALLVESIIRFLFKQGVREHQIGVITPYEGQRAYILASIFANEPGNLEIANVDAFQGREKDFIIVSLVRSNSFHGIGFVADKRRMNVALTRARHGLAIVGNPFTFAKSPIWGQLLRWYDEHGRIYEGPVGALRRTSLRAFDMQSISSAIVEKSE